MACCSLVITELQVEHKRAPFFGVSGAEPGRSDVLFPDPPRGTNGIRNRLGSGPVFVRVPVVGDNGTDHVVNGVLSGLNIHMEAVLPYGG